MIRSPFILVTLLLALVLTACGAPAPNAWPGLAANADLIFVAYNDKVTAVNLADGKERWRFPATNNGETFFADPGVSETTIVVGSEGPLGSSSGALFGVDPATGAQQWCLAFDENAGRRLNCPTTPDATKSILFGIQPPVDNRIIGGITVKDGIAYFGMANTNVYAVEAATGKWRWTFTAAEHPVWAAPLVDDGTVYVASLDHKLYAVDRADGELKWERDLGASLAGTPALMDDTLYVGTFGNQIVALNKENGEPVWTASATNWVWGSPVAQDGRVFAADLNGTLLALDAATGSVTWTQALGGGVRASPALADDLLIVGDRNGALFARRLSDGSEAWRQATVQGGGQLLSAPLVFAEKDLVVVAPYQGQNLLVAYTLSGAPYGPWQAFAPSQ